MHREEEKSCDQAWTPVLGERLRRSSCGRDDGWGVPRAAEKRDSVALEGG